MQIVLNGTPRTLASPVTVAELARDVAPAAKRIAVELNGEILPRSLHGQRQLTDGDRVEIVQAIGGG